MVVCVQCGNSEADVSAVSYSGRQGRERVGSGAGLPIDTNVSGGRMFIVTGNGGRNTPFKANSDYGESVIAFNIANGQLTPTDEWSAFNYQLLNQHDWDQGSGGLLMLPDQPGANPHLILTAGKEGRITLLNRDNLGGLASSTSSNTNAVQDFTVSAIPEGDGFWGTAAYWNENVYVWAGGEDGGTPNVGMLFKLNNGILTTTPSSKTTFTSAFPNPTFSVSSNGTQDGIAWAVKADQFNSGGPAVLYAFDANDISSILYESDKKSSDTAGPANKFSVPVVTNGKVYFATNGEVDVYGLLTAQQTAAAPVIAPDGGTFTSPQTVTLSSATSSASIYYTLDGSTPSTTSTLYTGAISVSTNTTIKAIATAPGYAQSLVSTASFMFSSQTPPVSFSPAAGTYASAQSITLSDADASAKIYYTTDGSTPSASSTLYSGPISVQISERINAIAIDANMQNSNVASAAYVIQSGSTNQTPAPSFSPAAGTYQTAQNVTLTDSDANAKIYYTTDGTTPSASSTLYSGPISVQTSETINAIAIDAGMQNSNVASAAYVIQSGSTNQTPAPSFSPTAGTYQTAQNVTLTDSDANAKIYYTTDGTTPSASSTLYSGPISVQTSETINAIAIDPSMQNSSVTSAAYVIQNSTNPPASFALASSPVAAINVGSSGTSQITVTPSDGFTGDVVLTCAITSSPAGKVNPPTCSVTEPQPITGTQATTATLTINTTTGTTTASIPARRWIGYGGGGVLAAVLLICMPRRRKWQTLFALVLLAVVGAAASGCGGAYKLTNPASKTSNVGTTPGTYTIVVTGTSGSMTETTAVSVSVQ